MNSHCLKRFSKKYLFRFVLTSLLIFFSSNYSWAQFDSSYAIKYPDRLGLSIFQSKPSYQLNVDQKLNRDTTGFSKINYTTLAKNISGFGFFYDKISLFIGFKSPLDKSDRIKKGRTNYSQIGLAITGVRLRLEASYKSYKGFYDLNSVNYIPNFSDTTSYFQNRDMVNHTLKVKAFYFLSKKKRFSYGAAYVNNVRQLHSAGSFILAANLYKFNLNSPAIVPLSIQNYFDPWQSWNTFNVTALSAGFGYTHTFTVFKRGFFNLLFTLGAEEQHVFSKSAKTNQVYDVWKTQLSAFDLRSSFGFNSKGFFISIQNIIDGNNYRLPQFDISNVYISTFLNLGYRFKVKTPAFYKKLQNTKLYKAI